MKNSEYPRPNFERDSVFFPEGSFYLPDGFLADRILLNARGAAGVKLNGVPIPSVDGTDVTDIIKPDGENALEGEGIWMESVPKLYIKSLDICVSPENGRVHFTFDLSENAEVSIEIYAGGELEAAGVTKNRGMELNISDIYEWSPENPFLYDVMITAGKDAVKTCFGIKRTTLENKNGRTAIAINGKPLFLKGTTDTDLKNIHGFNMIYARGRMSDKWYHECDRRGIIVWQEEPDEALSNFVCTTIYTVSNKKDADMTRLIYSDGGDIRRIGLGLGKDDGRAAVMLCKGKKDAFFRRAEKLKEKGLAAAVLMKK